MFKPFSFILNYLESFFWPLKMFTKIAIFSQNKTLWKGVSLIFWPIFDTIYFDQKILSKIYIETKW